MNAQLLLLFAVAAFRSQGREGVKRMLTPPQSALKAIPGRQNVDLAEIQAQFAQAAEQIAQGIEAIYDKDFADPDDLLRALALG